MSEQKKLLDQRKKMKAAQPHFVVKESHNVGCVKKRWRLPRGRHSGVRQYHKGKPALPTPGYGSPKGVYGLHRLGLKMVNICSKTDLEKINPQTEGAILSATLGTRKKLDL